jgi:hypothetical protein
MAQTEAHSFLSDGRHLGNGLKSAAVKANSSRLLALFGHAAMSELSLLSGGKAEVGFRAFQGQLLRRVQPIAATHSANFSAGV